MLNNIKALTLGWLTVTALSWVPGYREFKKSYSACICCIDSLQIMEMCDLSSKKHKSTSQIGGLPSCTRFQQYQAFCSTSILNSCTFLYMPLCCLPAD